MRSARLGIHDSLPDTGSAPARQQKPRHSRPTRRDYFFCDVRHSLRTLRQHPGYVAVVVLTPGFGIGINTATFSIVNAVLIRPLEFAQPDRLVALHESLPDFPDGPFSARLTRLRARSNGVRTCAHLNIPAELSGSGEPVRLDGAKISATLLPALGVAPLLGRGFTPEEDRPGIDVAILSWGLWQARFAGDPSIVGRTITLDRRPYAVVGVMPSTFSFRPAGRIQQQAGQRVDPDGIYRPAASVAWQRIQS